MTKRNKWPMAVTLFLHKMRISAVINSQQSTKILIDRKQKDTNDLFFYSKKRKRYVIGLETFLERIISNLESKAQLGLHAHNSKINY